MGYRSEVGVLITVPENKNSKDLLEEIRAGWNRNEPEIEDDFGLTFEDIKIEGQFIYLHAGWVKWYDDTFPALEWFMDYIKNLDVHFVRIGESYEDLEEIVYGDPEEYLRVERYMACDL